MYNDYNVKPNQIWRDYKKTEYHVVVLDLTFMINHGIIVKYKSLNSEATQVADIDSFITWYKYVQ
jgi:hypothetical protein